MFLLLAHLGRFLIRAEVGEEDGEKGWSGGWCAGVLRWGKRIPEGGDPS